MVVVALLCCSGYCTQLLRYMDIADCALRKSYSVLRYFCQFRSMKSQFSNSNGFYRVSFNELGLIYGKWRKSGHSCHKIRRAVVVLVVAQV